MRILVVYTDSELQSKFLVAEDERWLEFQGLMINVLDSDQALTEELLQSVHGGLDEWSSEVPDGPFDHVVLTYFVL